MRRLGSERSSVQGISPGQRHVRMPPTGKDTRQIQQGIMLEGLRFPSGLGTPLDPPRRTWNTLQGRRRSRCLPEPDPDRDEGRTKAG